MQDVKVKKALVEVKVLKVGNRQVTKAFVDQIPLVINPSWIFAVLENCQAIHDDQGLEFIGYINYFPGKGLSAASIRHMYITSSSAQQAWKSKWKFEPNDIYYEEKYSNGALKSIHRCKVYHVIFVNRGILHRAYFPIPIGFYVEWLDNLDQLYISI